MRLLLPRSSSSVVPFRHNLRRQLSRGFAATSADVEDAIGKGVLSRASGILDARAHILGTHFLSSFLFFLTAGRHKGSSIRHHAIINQLQIFCSITASTNIDPLVVHEELLVLHHLKARHAPHLSEGLEDIAASGPIWHNALATRSDLTRHGFLVAHLVETELGVNMMSRLTADLHRGDTLDAISGIHQKSHIHLSILPPSGSQIETSDKVRAIGCEQRHGTIHVHPLSCATTGAPPAGLRGEFQKLRRRQGLIHQQQAFGKTAPSRVVDEDLPVNLRMLQLWLLRGMILRADVGETPEFEGAFLQECVVLPIHGADVWITKTYTKLTTIPLNGKGFNGSNVTGVIITNTGQTRNAEFGSISGVPFCAFDGVHVILSLHSAGLARSVVAIACVAH